MKILLTCNECGYQEWGREGRLMNKIIMWNHIKRAHAEKADEILRRFETLPDDFYGVRQAEPARLEW